MDKTPVFDNWVEEAERVFCEALSDRQRFLLVVRLFSRCSWLLMLELFEHADAVLKRDFIYLLPDCVVSRLLSYLDVKTLLTACQVSKGWNSIISGNQRLWQSVCSRNGFLVSAVPSAVQLADVLFSKRLYLENVLLVKRLIRGLFTDTTYLRGHQGTIASMFFYNGRLATASRDNTVRIWCCSSGDCLAIYSMNSVNDIKFDDNFIVTGSADCSAACWDVTNGTRLISYIHAKPVFCLDFNTRVNILVTGSGDCTIKIWSFTDGNLLRTLEFANSTSLLDVCKVEIWDSVNFSLQPLYSYHILAASGHGENEENVLVIDYEIPRWGTTVLEKKEVLLDERYGMRFSEFHVVGSSLKVWCMEYVTSEDFTAVIEVSFDYVDVCGRRSFIRRPKNRVIHLSNCSDVSYLGGGACFDIFLEPSYDTTKRHGRIFVIRNNSKRIRFAIDLPESCFSSCNYDTCICNTQWLDGINEESVCGRPLFAVLNPDNVIQLLELKSLKY